MKEKDKKKDKNKIIIRLVKEAKPIAHWLIIAALIDVGAVICTVWAPDILGKLVQMLVDYSDAGLRGPIRNQMLSRLGLLLLAYGGSAGCGYLNMLLMNNVVTRHFTQGLRVQISDKIRRLPVRYVDQTPVGDILSRLIDDVGMMGGYIHQIFDVMVKGLLQIVLITVAMFLEDWRLAIFVVLLTPLSIWLSSKLSAACEKYFDDMFTQNGKMTELVEEAFSNYPTTKAYNLEDYMAEKHNEVNEQQRKLATKANFVGSVIQPVIRLSNAVAYILISLVGGWLVVRKGVGVGTVVTIVLYARQFASPLEQIAMGMGQMNNVKASARRVYEILDEKEEDSGAETLIRKPTGAVEFDHVNFSYSPDTPLIKDLTLTVQPGQNIAIVGPTGAGKTTIVNLLMRFYDINAGSIRLDGQDTASCSREDIRSAFGMVLQDTWLFRGTIAENVAYGKPGATREEIMAACRKAHCDHFIRTMPDGYDTVIGEDTTNLSGGQKQLLTIARALLADKPLLILDEATSNVDTRTEILIQKAMDELMAGKTCFVIAHRLSTIVDSDLILVLDHGQIVEQGTHRELLEKQGFYYKLYKSQYAV